MRRTWFPVLVLLLSSPVAAEYLVGYDETVGHPVRLLFGLLFLAPLYGVPALAIRELARRRGLGWGGVLLLAAAAGLLQAGVVDQSLFTVSVPNIPYWDDLVRPTFVPALGLSVANVLGFVGGHVVWSFAVPIAVAEGARPAVAEQGWLTWPWAIVGVVLWAGAAGAIGWGVHEASGAQLVGSLAVVVGLVLLALRCRPSTAQGRRPAWVLALVGLLAGSVVNLAPTTWVGTSAVAIVFAVAGLLVLRWARTPHHVLAVAGGACVARAVTGFWAPTVSDAAAGAVLGQHVLMLALSFALVAWGTLGRAQSTPVAAVEPVR